MKKIKLLYVLIFLILSYGLKAQTEGEKLKKITPDLNKKYGKSWSVGAFGGMPIIFGDVNSEYTNLGYGLNIQKVVGNNIAIRAQIGMGSMKGIDKKYATSNMIKSNPALNGVQDTLVNFVTKGYTYFNYKTNYKEANLHIQYNFAVNDFRSTEQPKINFYAFAGAGGLVFNSYTDQIDKNGKLYNFDTIYNRYMSGQYDQKTCKKEVAKLLDRNYETPGDGNPDGKAKTYEAVLMNGVFLPNANAGLGVRYRVSDRTDLALEFRGNYLDNDIIDGQRWDRTTYGVSANNDIMFNTTIGINIRLGKLDNIYWFDNPSAIHYKMTLENRRKIALLSSDIDNDGVSDYFDKDIATPEGVKVDATGTALDSDNDGIPDYKDNELFSDKGAVVDSNGVAVDADLDGVPDHKDLSPNTPKGQLVNFQGIPIGERGSQSGVSGTALGFLPAIFFDYDSDKLKTEYLPALMTVAQALQYNPNTKIKVIGYTDRHGTAEYNQQLGMRRAQTVVNYLVMQGIPAERLIIESKGMADPLTDVKTTDADRLNRRVQFQIGDKTEPVSTPVETPKPEEPQK